MTDMLARPVVSLHHVTSAGGVELVAANLPYTELLWTRRYAEPGEFSIGLAGDLPVTWPGRYIVTADGRDEAGVLEKVEGSWNGTGEPVRLSGRFLECLWDRYQLDAGGQTARGASWRQAVTAAIGSWHMPDLPPLRMGAGTQAPSGRGYSLSGDEGDSAAEVIFGCSYAHAARPVIGYDWGEDPGRLGVRIVSGVDRRRSQSANPWCVFSLQAGSALSIGYSGDYSTTCSEVMAHAEKESAGEGEEDVVIDRNVPVPGFSASTMWRARAYEDVTSLLDLDEVPTNAVVDELGSLRAQDHMPSLAVDASSTAEGYRKWWDVGDTVDVDIPEIQMQASAEVQEVEECYDGEGFRLGVTVGTKQISRVARAIMGRR